MDLDKILPPDHNPAWLQDNIIFLVRHGSHAYGTATPTSDLDVKGVCVPPLEYWLGYANVFEQSTRSEPADLVIYNIRKFVSLASDCNPSLIEVLFVNDSDILLCSEAGEVLRAHRDLFLSQKAKHTFSGYAISQLKRIKTHRRWLMNPPKSEPQRSDYDLPEHRALAVDQRGAAMARIQQVIDGWELDLSDLDKARRMHIHEQLAKVIHERTTGDEFREAGRLIGFEENFLDYLDREKRYQNAHREWTQYLQWKCERNPARAELEAKFGFDCKHASHLVRLLRMCREILEGKGVIVKRPDAEELLAIRNGAWEYERLVEWAEREDEALWAVMRASKLPKAPPRARLDELCRRLVMNHLHLEETLG